MAYQNDVGTVLEVEIIEEGHALPIPSGSTLIMRIRKPNGQVVEKTATLQTDGTDGMIEYVVVAGDLDQFGEYQVQGHVTFPAAAGKWSSDVETFEVKEILRNKR